MKAIFILKGWWRTS
ncbi:trp operon leader peptide [Escherichia coli]|nr:trp operon leader peptide [Escherichia coli]EEZ5090143.1 trp operon leader peptide [Escherichia coli]EFC1736706.1 trp operon leader peptide [Escherichia coli]EFD5279630.1 trp operon leader peptide [Escherichia coli]EFE3647716.1 trp operon leader peptide [Escherichia coli]EFI1302956.1 trp operon leader peptide [Escherichia coli]